MSTHSSQVASLNERFEVVKEIGDGSFGSVVLARTRSAASHIARRGTMVAIKTMKKSFESFAPCLELREVIFLRSLPAHCHLVPALDIFLDPSTKKLHIAMEYMDANLYQLMKSRDHKPLEPAAVKSILYQILSGLEHIHAHGFFHRDIKPENILVSTSGAISENTSTFRRYSNLVTPPSTPQTYTVKIADFGLAREIASRAPYTTYVSTRWYRAPEVLLRAGEYSAPVDIWAVGAMAVEIATLKPLFPGQNEVDQVWRVCEVMGSPGNWVSKSGRKLGGGEWREGARLAQKLGFSFPKMTPVHMESILQAPQWPSSLCNFVTQCLLWDPKNRPTSVQALQHEYFQDAVDPLRPRSSTPSRVSRKQSELNSRQSREPVEQTLSARPSWFRKSFIGSSSREVLNSTPQISILNSPRNPAPSPQATAEKKLDKRATWHPQHTTPVIGAPMPILPSIRPISPLSDAVTAQAARANDDRRRSVMDEKTAKKIGRQLSINSVHAQFSDKTSHQHPANGQLMSPPAGKESTSFFSLSHLRKRARRLSGRNALPVSPDSDDLEAQAGCAPWGGSNRSSMIMGDQSNPNTSGANDMRELDRAIQSVNYALDDGQGNYGQAKYTTNSRTGQRTTQFPPTPGASRSDTHSQNGTTFSTQNGQVTSRTTRRPAVKSQIGNRYDTPDENDELLDEAIYSAAQVFKRLDRQSYQGTPPPQQRDSVYGSQSVNGSSRNSYYAQQPASQSTNNRHTMVYASSAAKNIEVAKPKRRDDVEQPKWPTPPYDDGDWLHPSRNQHAIYSNGSVKR